jgi:hypothetical protein
MLNLHDDIGHAAIVAVTLLVPLTPIFMDMESPGFNADPPRERPPPGLEVSPERWLSMKEWIGF